MKNIYLFLLCGTTILFFFSCKDDNIDNTNPGTTANEWIENTMRDYYYWYQDIPESSELNYESDPSEFFKSLLSDKDGKTRGSLDHNYYSTINKTTTTRSTININLSLGFEFQVYRITDLHIYALHVLYLLPDSPASRSNLKRGDWIFSINDQPVTPELAKQINSGINIKLGISEMTRPEITKWVTLSAEAVINNPVYVDTMYYYNDKKIAYLVYNHFTKGLDKNNTKDETFNNDLRKAISNLKKENPDDFILDLRYNGGGLVSSAQLLATMLAPTSALGDVFCKITYNDKQSSKNHSLTFDSNYMKQGTTPGENLNLKRLFVITSTRTASASEAVINGLEPFMGDNIILIGDNTEGKNMGSLTYTDSRFDWELHPIVCSISNKNNFSDYSSGFSPNIKCIEPYTSLYDLGDTNEYLLNQTLEYITGNRRTITQEIPDINSMNLIPVGSSLYAGGMIISQE